MLVNKVAPFVARQFVGRGAHVVAGVGVAYLDEKKAVGFGRADMLNENGKVGVGGAGVGLAGGWLHGRVSFLAGYGRQIVEAGVRRVNRLRAARRGRGREA